MLRPPDRPDAIPLMKFLWRPYSDVRRNLQPPDVFRAGSDHVQPLD